MLNKNTLKSGIFPLCFIIELNFVNILGQFLKNMYKNISVGVKTYNDAQNKDSVSIL